MAHTIIVCTDRNLTWEALSRFAAVEGVALRRVAALSEVCAVDGLAVDAVVVDDRFLPIITQVERSARRHAAIYGEAVFMTAGEALDALWHGPLAEHHTPAAALADWVAQTRLHSAA